MQASTALIWWYLNVLTKKRYDALKQVFGDLDTALPDLSFGMLRELGLQEATARGVMVRLEEMDAARMLADCAKAKVELVSIEDETYPEVLRNIGDPPIFLSYIGDLSLLSQPLVGIVGTREMSQYGRRVVEAFVAPIVQAGVVTVSGLALGVDAAVARETMHAGGRTIAVLGHGLRTIYPKSNEELAEEIVARGGLLLSEFPLDLPPEKYTFPARNRIIAGLSLGTLICEAPDGSGSIITAELALEYNRDVFAVPGPIFDGNFSGCHRLISQGHAKLVTDPRQILEEIGIVAPESTLAATYEPTSLEEAAVLEALTTMPQNLDELIERSSLDAARIGTALTMMELAGIVKNVGSGQWVRM